MPRLPYKPHDDAGPEEVVAPIRARRGGTLLNLDRQLLHSPPLALGWNRPSFTASSPATADPPRATVAVSAAADQILRNISRSLRLGRLASPV